MTLQNRVAIIDQLGTVLESPVIAYVTGDRPGMQTQISNDQPPLFPRHLAAIGHPDRLNLLLHTRGGDTNVPWTVVAFLREHCKFLTVLVPYAAHSSGTLLALGADEIIMAPYATLSPIDPTVANAFNPLDPVNQQNRLPIAVEDVLAFLELAEKTGGGGRRRAERERAKAFDRLAASVHPLALGNVQRSINQIRQLAKKLIQLHPPELSSKAIADLVTRLTTQFYSHQHEIGRREAREMGLPVVDALPAVEALLLAYHQELKADLELLEPFDPQRTLAAHQPPPGPQGQAPGVQGAILPGVVTVALERAYIETKATCDAFITRADIAQQMVQLPLVGQPGVPPQPQQAIGVEVTSERWEKLA